jgi:hypothetical protein
LCFATVLCVLEGIILRDKKWLKRQPQAARQTGGFVSENPKPNLNDKKLFDEFWRQRQIG